MVRTINQSYQAKYIAGKRKRIILKVLFWFAVFAGVLAGVIYLFFFSKLFNIREISINNGSFVKNGEIRETVDNYLGERKFFIPRFSNIFFVDSDEIQALVAGGFPQAENITVNKNYFHTLEINLNKREALGVWCFKDKNCFYFDRMGTAFDTAANSDGSLFLSIDDKSKTLDKLGGKVTEEPMLNFIFGVQEEMQKLKIGITKIIIPDGEPFRINVKTSENWELYLNTQDDLVNQMKSLNTFLSQKISPEKRSQLQYIDVRIPNRVYYK